LSTHPISVTSSTGKNLLLDVGAIRFSADSTRSDTHSPGSVTLTLTNPAKTESHAWTFNLSTDSFSTAANGNGHLNSGTQLKPFGQTALTISALHGGVKHSCAADNYQIRHKVALKGSVTLKTHSSGTNSWGNVSLDSATFKGTLFGGHGPDNEEACSGYPPCVSGISWLATKGNLTLSGSAVAPKGKSPVSTLDANRLVQITSPAQAIRVDDVTTPAPAPTLSKLNGHKTLSVTTNSTGPADGDAALASTGKSPYANGCGGGEEKGALWNAAYATADLPLTFSEDIFGPLSISSSKSATFEKFHVA
jgi:hypothetical protein